MSNFRSFYKGSLYDDASPYLKSQTWTIETDGIVEMYRSYPPCSHVTQKDSGNMGKRRWHVPKLFRVYDENGYSPRLICLDCIVEEAKKLEEA